TTHAITGQSVWFNQIATQHANRTGMGDRWAAFEAQYRGRPKPYDVLFGDGEPIPEEEVLAIYPLLESVTVAFPWQAGDVMLVDNVNTAHGRNPYAGE